jgi:hypothetical protein
MKARCLFFSKNQTFIRHTFAGAFVARFSPQLANAMVCRIFMDEITRYRAYVKGRGEMTKHRE